MKKVILKIDKKNIPIFIGDHIITKIDFSKYIKGNDVVIITNKVLAKLHLDKVGATLSKLSNEQAEYIGVPVQGPFKSDNYRY